jgi:formylglycine-generating enzyme required for sulfatase activity
MEESVNKQKTGNKLLLILGAIVLIAITGAIIWYFSHNAKVSLTADTDVVINIDNQKIDLEANKPKTIELGIGTYSLEILEKKYNFSEKAEIEIKSRFEKQEHKFSFRSKIAEEEAILAARQNKTIAGYKKYLTDFPNGRYAKEADEGVVFLTSQMDEDLIKADSAAFETAKKTGKILSFEEYKKLFPKGIYVNEANENIKVLKEKDTLAFEQAQKENTIPAFEIYIKNTKDGLFLNEANNEIKRIKAEIEHRKKDNDAFDLAKKENTIEAYKAYLADFPKAYNSKEANAKIKEIEEENYRRWVANEEPIWQKAVKTEKITDYEKYIDTYPRGKYISEAKSMYSMLDKEQKYQLKAPPGFKYVEGGTFEMGSNKGSGDESPVHSVKLESFYISKYEITNEQYAKFLNEYGGDVVKSGDSKGQAMIYSDDWGVTFDGNKWKAQIGYEEHPVIYVTWYGAKEYCAFYGYRLPSEAEWEFAANGGIKANAKTLYSGSNNPKAVAWYYETATTTMKVGKKGANRLGIYDMTGNVWEWVEDWHEKNYYSRSPKIDPKGPASGITKVLRGGSFFEITNKLRITYRDFSYPIIGYYNYGFRPVKDIKD